MKRAVEGAVPPDRLQKRRQQGRRGKLYPNTSTEGREDAYLQSADQADARTQGCTGLVAAGYMGEWQWGLEAHPCLGMSLVPATAPWSTQAPGGAQ